MLNKDLQGNIEACRVRRTKKHLPQPGVEPGKITINVQERRKRKKRKETEKGLCVSVSF